MRQALPQGGLSTRLHVLILLASLTFAAATEPSQQNTQKELLQPLLPKSSAQTSSEAPTASTGNAPARPEKDSGNNKDTAASPWLQECQSLPVCSAPALLETVVPTILGFCPAQPFKVDLSAEHQVSGNDSCASLQNSTLQEIALEAVPQQHERAAKQPLVSDSSEEERHNFALSKDGAKIVGSNKEAKKTSAILDTDSDTFMKNECKADKWFIIELSQVAKVDAFQLSQYELYSSRVKDFEVRGRQAHPRAQGGDYSKSFNTSGWQLMGKYTAVKMKGSQTFTVAEPAWLKFLQFHFLSHHGSEPMCALNDVLVFGKSAAEDLEDQLSDETLLQDSADVSAEKTAGPVTADDVSNTQPGQLQPVLLAAVQGEAGPMDRADASRAAGLQHGNLQAGNASGVSKAANEQQAALNSTAGSHPQGKQDTEQRASGQLQQSEPSDTSDVSTSNVELENEALLQAAPLIAEEAKAAIKAEVRAEQSEELLLPHNSAGSAKSRHGGSIYDMLVQEIKSLKLQQKQAPRQLAELQRNLSVHMEKTAAELTALDQTVKGLQADLDLMRRIKSHDVEDSSTALATLADVDVDLRAVLAQLESMQRALHQVQHRVTAIVLLAIIAWLGVVVLTAPALGQLTWILWIPICFIAAIGILWLMPCIFRILPGNL